MIFAISKMTRHMPFSREKLPWKQVHSIIITFLINVMGCIGFLSEETLVKTKLLPNRNVLSYQQALALLNGQKVQLCTKYFQTGFTVMHQ